MGFCSLASKAEDQIYLIGGFDDTGNKRRLESLNLDSMEWTRLADLNQNRSMAGCANFKGALFNFKIGGCQNLALFTNICWRQKNS